MKSIHSLKAKILVVFIPVIVLTLFILSFFAYRVAQRLTMQSLNNEIQTGLDLGQQSIEASLAKNELVSQSLAKAASAGGNTLSKEQYAKVLPDIVSANNETFGGGIWFEPFAYNPMQQFLCHYCMRENGSIIYVDNYSLGDGVYYTDQEWYTSVTGGNLNTAWSKPYYDSFAKVSMITSSNPIYNMAGQFIGVATADIDLTEIQRMVAGLQIDGKGTAFLIDSDGVYIGSDDSEKLMNMQIQNETNSSLAQLGEQMLSQKSGNGTYEENGEQYHAYFAPVLNGQLILAITLSDKEIYGEINSMRNTMFLICVIATLLLILLLTIYTSVTIVNPLKRLSKIIQIIAQGELNTQVTYSSKDEIGLIASGLSKTVDRLKTYIDYIHEISTVLDRIADGKLNFMLKHTYSGDFARIKESLEHISSSFNNTLRQINESADRVSSEASQVANNAQSLSQGASEQASSVEELAATITDISQKVQLNAASAQEASGRAEENAQNMTYSSQRMQEMTKAISEIAVSSHEIGKIIKTIEDIAFQTNILALNAAVEAARAGVAGKGFAVVADEVRSLAGKSAEASKNTAALIERSVHAVEHGVQITDETSQALLTAVEGAQGISKIIDQISLESKKQADFLAQVSQSVEQISNVVQTTSATAQESSAASEELSAQANTLKMLVDKFEISADEIYL